MNYTSFIPLLLVITFALGIRIVRPIERGLIERLGRYKRYARQGFNWIVPFVDKMVQVNITERMADVKPQDIITKDNLNARVDLVVYYKVKADEENVKRSIYNVDNFENQIISLAQTTARNVIGEMDFTEVNNQRNKLNAELAKVLDKESDTWGVQIVRVELKEIKPPEDVQETMNRIIKASNEKQAAIDFAQATETKADGERRAAIKKAEGIRDGKKIVADGEAYKIKTVNESAKKYFVGNAQLLKKLQVTQASLEQNSKILLTEKGISPQIILGEIPVKK